MSEHSDQRTLAWGIIGPGTIASVFCGALRSADAGNVVQVAGRDVERASAFAAGHGIAHASTPDALIASSDVDVIYVATPHTSHARYASAALLAGKAVLCEKPLTMSADETRCVLEASETSGSPLMEAWMYRTHPQIRRIIELIESDTIGKVRSISTAFGARAHGTLPERILRPELGGGVIQDIGGYPLSAVLRIAAIQSESCGIPSFDEVRSTCATTGVELHAEWRGIVGDGIEVDLACSVQEDLGRHLHIIGERGRIEAPHPFLPEGSRSGVVGEVQVTTEHESWVDRPTSTCCCFALEAKEMARMMTSGEREPADPCVSHAESALITDGLHEWCKRARPESESALLSNESGERDARNA